MHRWVLAVALALAAPALAAPPFAPVVQTAGVHVNGRVLTAAQVADLQARIGQPVPAGSYWYDGASGLWGYWGGPAQGAVSPGLDLGALPANASGGGTRVFFNGRELHPTEVAWLQQRYGSVAAGRYTLSANGDVGLEGGPVLVNLWAPVSSGPAPGSDRVCITKDDFSTEYCI